VGYKIVFTSTALRDLEKIHAYIAKDNPAAANRFALKLIASAETLAAFPQRGSLLLGRPGVRFVLEQPYLVIYRIDETLESVRVLRFWHGSRERKWMRL
jgi:addiction module RelE/StbE family toxin